MTDKRREIDIDFNLQNVTLAEATELYDMVLSEMDKRGIETHGCGMAISPPEDSPQPRMGP